MNEHIHFMDNITPEGIKFINSLIGKNYKETWEVRCGTEIIMDCYDSWEDAKSHAKDHNSIRHAVDVDGLYKAYRMINGYEFEVYF